MRNRPGSECSKRHTRAARRARWLALLLTCVLFAFTSRGAEFTASLDRDSIVLGETATLTLKLEGLQARQPPTLPAIPGLQINSQGMSQMFNQVNNQLTASVVYAFAITATRIGDYTIPALGIEAEGQRFTTQPLRLRVLASDPSAPPENKADQPAFLWLVVPKGELFVGELITAELRLYVRQGIVTVSDIQIPPLAADGIVAGKYIQGGQFQRRVGEAVFTIVPFQLSLQPVKAGTLSLGPINGSVVAHTPAGQRTAFDFFGPRTVGHQVPLTLEPRVIRALPLPQQNVPSDFTGAVGRFTLASSAGPTNLAVGDPITVRVQISGEGALDTLTLPPHPWTGFKTIPASATVEYENPLGTRGRKVFEQIVVPQSPDITALPSLSFSFFDPETKTYKSLATPPTPLDVRPAAAGAAPVVASGTAREEETQPVRDILPIKQRPGTLVAAHAPLLRQPWFVASQFVPACLLLGAVLWRRRQDTIARNPRLQRRKQTAEILRSGLGDLRHAASANNSDAFFATLFRLLQEKLGERIDAPASSITESVIEDHLRPRGIPDPTLQSIHDLFQACNLARYAPIKDSQELAAFIPRLESVVAELDRLKS